MAAAVPTVSVTHCTPPKSAEPLANAYRLLYRGALSLPDSLLLLDGLTFSARLDSPSKNNQLLQNPLALALESMRGRPSLRFMGLVNLHDGNLWWDESGGIELDIHPRATLTRIYFENIFCLTPFASTSKASPASSPSSTSDFGIKVALGDSDGPETTQVVIFAHESGESESGQDSRTLKLAVARLTARPPPPQAPLLRLPRPDDPTPRKPPAFYNGDIGTQSGIERELKRVASKGPLAPGRELKRVASISNANAKRKKLTATAGAEARAGDGKSMVKGDAVFKVPELPVHGRSNVKGKGKRVEGEVDVFGSTDADTRQPAHSHGKGKRKRGADDDVDQREGATMERANKDAIKRCTLDHLYKTKDPTTSTVRIDKSHPEFKDLFGMISRGVGYALRAHMKVRPVDLTQVDRLVRVHLNMYLGGHGGSAVQGFQGDRALQDPTAM
ncbi:hypothetical protein LshimejAT787_0410110 [Lyophyllum shimeji]|uniref:Sld7 C-terminal domain-containing protein n=1 Tax=Lyophyllum shimeji TaxID=47721 RepID=A0A9P3UNK5_LYOSH|nr:hypothetical protein LshimejAT787_0410110 [Lyophyllum shimeji]